MKSVFRFFTPHIEMSLFDKLRTRSFIIITFIGLLMLGILTINTLVNPTKNFMATISSVSAIFIFLIITLFLLQKKGIRIAGNTLSLGLILLISVTVNMLNPEISILYKYTQGFYTYFLFLAVSNLFATRGILLINSTIVIASTTHVFLFGMEHFPDQLSLIRTGYIQHLSVTIMMTTVMYLAILFSEKAVESANRNAQIKANHTKKLQAGFALIAETSLVLKKLSIKINKSAESMSSSSSEQAASLEEISTTIEEIASSIGNNSENSQSTAQTVSNTAQSAKKNELAIQKTLEAIEEVSSKITVIQEIANRTEILSINAAIEAARAGESGLGFSVVAQEVKKLAEKSNMGAAEIIELIQQTKNISSIAGENYKKISADIMLIDSAVNEISLSTVEQNTSVNEMNSAIGQVNESSQSNASFAADLFDSAQEIQLYINKLDDTLIENKT